MRLEIAERPGQCKLWVTREELESMQRVAATGDPLILPDDVVAHLKGDHRHEAFAVFPLRYPAAPLLGIQVHVEQDAFGWDT